MTQLNKSKVKLFNQRLLSTFKIQIKISSLEVYFECIQSNVGHWLFTKIEGQAVTRVYLFWSFGIKDKDIIFLSLKFKVEDENLGMKDSKTNLFLLNPTQIVKIGSSSFRSDSHTFSNIS